MGSYPPQGYPVAAPPAVDTRGNTIVIAASNSLDPTLAPPAYRCDGTNDQVEINAAITALGATGGSVMLLEGQYNISGQINLATGTALVGQGAGTVLRIPNGHDAHLNVIVASNVNRVLVKNLRIDGNKTNQTAGNMDGIYFSTVTDSKIIDCWAENLRRYGIFLSYSEANIISGNDCYSNATGIYLGTDASHNSIVGNTCASNTSYGIYIEWSLYRNVEQVETISDECDPSVVGHQGCRSCGGSEATGQVEAEHHSRVLAHYHPEDTSVGDE